MTNNKNLTVADLLNDGIQPGSITPESDNLTAAMAAAAKLNVVEMTYLVSRLQGDLEAYRARLTVELFNERKSK
jgi:hypothetical protein